MKLIDSEIEQRAKVGRKSREGRWITTTTAEERPYAGHRIADHEHAE
jgi:hypothetical protein